MATQVNAKLITFDQIQQGKTLLKLKDGNFLEIILVVHKVFKTDKSNPSSEEPVYDVQTSFAVTVWKPEEVAQFEEA